MWVGVIKTVFVTYIFKRAYLNVHLPEATEAPQAPAKARSQGWRQIRNSRGPDERNYYKDFALRAELRSIFPKISHFAATATRLIFHRNSQFALGVR